MSSNNNPPNSLKLQYKDNKENNETEVLDSNHLALIDINIGAVKQHILNKTKLNFNETCKYLDIRPSHLYKLTSTKHIPHFWPQGKKLYFKREELDTWLQRNRKAAKNEIDPMAIDYVIRNKRSK